MNVYLGPQAYSVGHSPCMCTPLLQSQIVSHDLDVSGVCMNSMRSQALLAATLPVLGTTSGVDLRP